MAIRFRNQDKMSEQNISPIVNDAKLPRMDETEKLTVEKSSRTGKDEMQSSLENREKAQSPESKQEGNFMEPFKSPDKPKKIAVSPSLPPLPVLIW